MTKQEIVNTFILDRIKQDGKISTWDIEKYFTLNPVIIDGEQKKIMGSSALRYCRMLASGKDAKIRKFGRHNFISAELFI